MTKLNVTGGGFHLKKLQQPKGRLWPYIDHANEVYTNERFFAVQNINGYWYRIAWGKHINLNGV